MAEIGEVVLADGCLFLDRIRSRDKNAFDWGLWGGGCVPQPSYDCWRDMARMVDVGSFAGWPGDPGVPAAVPARLLPPVPALLLPSSL